MSAHSNGYCHPIQVTFWYEIGLVTYAVEGLGVPDSISRRKGLEDVNFSGIIVYLHGCKEDESHMFRDAELCSSVYIDFPRSLAKALFKKSTNFEDIKAELFISTASDNIQRILTASFQLGQEKVGPWEALLNTDHIYPPLPTPSPVRSVASDKNSQTAKLGDSAGCQVFKGTEAFKVHISDA